MIEYIGTRIGNFIEKLSCAFGACGQQAHSFSVAFSCRP